MKQQQQQIWSLSLDAPARVPVSLFPLTSGAFFSSHGKQVDNMPEYVMSRRAVA